MYFFSHLFIGLLLGIVFFWWTRDRWLIPACAFGAVLPDLVDKPVGYLLMDGTLYFSRTYCHTLLFFLLVLAVGILVWRRYESLLLVGVAAGILSHQVLDFMWEEYWNWLWPFFGPFRGGVSEEYLLARLFEILSNPSEWIVGFCILPVFLLFFFRGELLFESDIKYRLGVLAFIAMAMTIAGIIFVSHNSPLI